MTAPQIPGYDPSYLVPKFVAQLIMGAGKVSAGSEKLICLLVGMKTSSGSMTVDVDVLDCQDEDTADSLAGPGSQLARMVYKAVTVPNVKVKIAAVAEPTGAVATATIGLGGAITAGGTWKLRIAGETITGGFLASNVFDDIGAAMAAAINGRTRLPVTAAYATPTLTISTKNKGLSAKDWMLAIDRTSMSATGLTATLTGSASVGNADRVRFGAAGGTGTESITNILTKLLSERYARVGAAQNDATNAPLWIAQLNAKAQPTILRLEHVTFGYNGTLTNAQTLAQTTLNAYRAVVAEARNLESHPAEIAALVAAWRSVIEQTAPVPDYDGFPLPGLCPVQAVYATDNPTDTEQNTALNNGVTILKTEDGVVKIVRGVISHCLSNSVQDMRTLDIGDATFPDYGVLDLKDEYDTEFRPANKLVGPDPGPEDEDPPPGVGTPRIWNSVALDRMLVWFGNGWIIDPRTEGYQPFSDFDVAADRIMMDAPMGVRRVQHGLGVVARQIHNAA